MRTFWNQFNRYSMRGTWVALLTLVVIGLMATSAFAQSVVISSPISFYANGKYPPSSGALAGGVPAGGTISMNPMGTIVTSDTYGGEVIQFTLSGSSYTEVEVGPYSNAGAAVIDPIDNSLWVGGQYSNAIAKIPMSSNGTYSFSVDPSSGNLTTDCTGTSSDANGECLVANLKNGYFGVESMAFDAAGDLFFATTNQTYSGDPITTYSIYECVLGTPSTPSTSCLYGTAAPVQIFQEPGPVTITYTPSGGTQTTVNAQLWVGALALDPQGNLFFTDSAIISDQESAYSELNEIPYNSAIPGYSSTQETTIATDTAVTADAPLPNGGDYDDQIVTVGVAPGTGGTNTVYFGATDAGIFGVTDNSGTTGNPTTGTPYGVANANGDKLILPDGKGNFYVDAYNNSDWLGFIAVGNATDPVVTGAGQATTFIVNVSDTGSAACTATTPPTLSFTVTGTDAADFDASKTPPTAGACGTQLFGTTFPVTVTFSPLKLGTLTATLTAEDSSTSAQGTATLTGTAETKQAISFSPTTPLTYSSGLTIALTATGGASGNPVTFTLVSGPATFDATVADQLDVSAPGTIVVTANQAGSPSTCTTTCYAPAPPVTASIVVQQIAQAIAFTPPPPRNVTTAASPITLTATGGVSGNPVLFTVDKASTNTTASITNNTPGATTFTGALTFTGTGTIIVDANQAGNTDYAAAPQIQATIDVTASVLATGPPVIMSQSTFLGIMTGGGATASQNPDGGTMAIDPNGNLLIGSAYGSDGVLSFNLSNTNPGHQSAIVSTSNAEDAIAVDANGNLFAGLTYGINGKTCTGPCVLKIPYVNGSYTPISALPAATAACTGTTTDTSACWMTNVTAGSTYPIQSLAFDAQGDLFYGIQIAGLGSSGTAGVSYQGSIWECTAACLYSGTPAPVMLWDEPTVNNTAGTNSATTSLSPTTPVSQVLGGLAVDSVGNLFFTDTAEDSQSLIHYTDLYELPYNSTTGYAVSPTTLVTEIVNPPAQYPSEIDAVTIDPTSGNVYFSDQSATYAFADDLTAPLDPTTVQASMWTISGQGGKYIAAGKNGTLYTAEYSSVASKDAVYYVTLNNVNVLGSVNDGQSATVPDTSNCENSSGLWAACSSSDTTSVNAMYTVLNDGGCVPTPETVTFAATDSQFTAALTLSGTTSAPTCNGTVTNGSWFPTTLTFTPSTGSGGTISETMTATDSLSNTGTATVSGTAVALTAQAITGFSGITSPVTYGSGPYTLSATGGGSGNPVVFSIDTTDSTAGVAAVSGNNGTTLNITGTGTLYIYANQAGNSTYAAAPQVKEGPFTVNAAAQTIVFGAPLANTTSTSPYQVGYGTSPITLTATDSNVVGAGSAEPITFSLDSSSATGAATLTNGVLDITGLGLIVVDANQVASSNGDYAAAAQVQAFIDVVQGTQTITFTSPSNTPPTATVAYPNTFSLAATGGASGNAVTFSIVSGGAIATLSGSTLTPTGTAFGPVVVAANQLGNTDYSPATAVDATITFTAVGTVATPTFSPASGSTLVVGTNNTVTISDTTANATIYYTTDGSTPTAIPADLYTAPFTLTTTGTATVNAIAVETGYAPSAEGTATYTVTTVPPSFTATATPTGAVLGPGQSQAFFISMMPTGGFTGTVSFACSGQPSGVTCAFNPSTVTSDGTDEFSTTLTVTNGSTSSALRHDSIPFIPTGATFAVALCFLGWKRRRNLALGLVLMAGIFGLTQLSGCGGGSGPKQTTSTMTVTATSTVGTTTITQTIPLTITIQQ